MTQSSPTSYQEYLADNPFFGVLDKDEIANLADLAVLSRYQFGQTIIDQGSYCDGLFLVVTGSVRLFGQEDGKEISMGLRKPGDLFAEVNVLRNSRMEYTVRATAASEILMIPRAPLSQIWQKNEKVEAYMTRYAAIKTAGGLVARLFDLKGEGGKKDFEALVETIGIKRVEAGQLVLRQDTFDDRRLYVIRQGSVRVVRQEGGQEFKIAVLGKGDIFGEKAALLSDVQPANVITESQSIFLVIPDSTLKLILDEHPSLRSGFEERIAFFEQELERQTRLARNQAGRWHFSPADEASFGAKVLERFPLVEQEEEMDCGAACLAMICRYNGIQTRMEQLRDFSDTDTRGATLESLAVAGERLGFIARGLELTFAGLTDLELPLIAHWQGYHYVVVYGVSRYQVYVADPAIGFKKLTRTEFERGWDGTCLLLEPDKQLLTDSEGAQRKPVGGHLFRLVRGYALPTAMATLLLGLLAPVYALLLAGLVDKAVIPDQLMSSGVFVLAFLGLSLLGGLVALMGQLIGGNLKYGIARKASSGFIQQILYQPLEFFERRKLSDLLARFTDHDQFWQFVAGRSVLLMTAAWTLSFCILGLVYLHPTVGLIFLGIQLFVPVLLWLQALQSRPAVLPDNHSNSGFLEQMLRGIEAIKAQGAEYWMRCRWLAFTRLQNDLQHAKFRRDALYRFAIVLVQCVAITVVLWQGNLLFYSGQLTLGEWLAALLLAIATFKPIGDLAAGWLQWLTIRPALQRVESIRRLQPEQNLEQSAENIVLPDLKGAVSIENLYFRYRAHSSYVLEGLNVTVAAQQWLNIVGPAGSGKTTLAKILMGFYSIGEGRVEIDGYPLYLLEKGSYRRQIGYVSGTPHLIQGTLMDNIALGVRAPERKQIVDVCRLVGLGDWVEQLPGGYEHQVHENDQLFTIDGLQRLGVARALVRNPAMIIFDQALSSLEPKAEGGILNQIHRANPERTMITFAETINPALVAEQVLLLNNGRITKQKSSSELTGELGSYSKLPGL